MAGLTPAHLLIIMVVALIVVGPGRLPEVGAAIGKSIREFQRATSGITDTVSGVMSGTLAPPANPTQPAAPTQPAPPAQSYYAAGTAYQAPTAPAPVAYPVMSAPTAPAPVAYPVMSAPTAPVNYPVMSAPAAPVNYPVMSAPAAPVDDAVAAPADGQPPAPSSAG
jgi:TatA/E family protein of Tat protein translocase